MSRIGRAPIPVPDGVQVQLSPGMVRVSGPKGDLSRSIPVGMQVSLADGQVLVTRASDSGPHRALHGLTRSIIANLVTGVSSGFEKKIEIYGVGYRAQSQGAKLTLQLGYSHPIELTLPAGLSISSLETFTPTSANEWMSTRFTVAGADKEQVGQFAANVRAYRSVEPYKGKGIKYAGERVRRKAGKAGAKGKGAH